MITETCTQCGGAQRTLVTVTQCRNCAPPIDLIQIEGIEFQRTEVGTLKVHRQRVRHRDSIMSAKQARDLATFLLQNFYAPEDYP